MVQRIKFRRGTASQWTTANPVLGDSEPGIETTAAPEETEKLKIGDGVTPWNSLPYFAGEALPAGSYFGPASPVIGATTTAVVGSVKVTGEASDRLRIRADGALLGGVGGVAPTVEFKPAANGTGWEVNKGNLKVRADASSAVAPELHFHSNRGAGNDNLAWGIGIDVANLNNQSQDLAFFKGIGGSVADEFYGNGRRTLAATWGFGQAPADDAFKLSVVSSVAGGSTTIAAGSHGLSLPRATVNVASTSGFATSGMTLVATSNGPQAVWYTGVTGTSFTGCTGGTGTMSTGGAVGDVNMGGLKIQTGSTTIGPAFLIRDGAGLDRIWLKSDGTLTGNHGLAGSAVCIEAEPTNHRTLVMRDSDGTNYFGWYYTGGNLRIRSISGALDFMQFSTAANHVYVYRPFVAGNGAVIGAAPAQLVGLYGATGSAQKSAVVNADGTLADLTTKFNLMLAYWRTRGDVAP